MENTICKNCGNPVERKFCPDCGQSASVGRVNLRTILNEFAHGVVHVDKGILYTARELTLRPGQTIRNYFDGKRALLFKPFGYLVLFTSVYLFISHLSGQALTNIRVGSVDESEAGVLLSERTDVIMGFLENNFSLLTFCSIPFFSLITFAFFRRAGFNYGEHLIMNSYIHGHSTLVSILLIPLYRILPDGVLLILLQVLLLGIVVYMVASVFDKYKMWKRILYSFLVYAIFCITISIFVAVYLLIYILPHII